MSRKIDLDHKYPEPVYAETILLDGQGHIDAIAIEVQAGGNDFLSDWGSIGPCVRIRMSNEGKYATVGFGADNRAEYEQSIVTLTKIREAICRAEYALATEWEAHKARVTAHNAAIDAEEAE